MTLALASSARGREIAFSGRVTGPDSLPLAGAVIKLAGRASYATTTGPDGGFRIASVTPGRYRLEVRRIGYRVHVDSLELDAGKEPSAELRVRLDELPAELPGVTVTASRTPQLASTATTPVDIVPRSEIERRRPLYLSDLLAEQTGLQVISDHGSGVRMQGLDPDYTLVLVDGEPLIGRTAGTLDLTRISMENVEKVEIVKGPTSSLYGSDALAGVINVVTRRPEGRLAGGLGVRFGSERTLDLTADGSYGTGIFSGSLRAERISSDGYDLTPATIAPTVAPYVTWTVQPRFELRPSEATTWILSSQLSTSSQESPDLFDVAGESVPVTYTSRRTEWSVAPTLRQRLGADATITAKVYLSGYDTDEHALSTTDELYRSRFDQLYLKGEAQLDLALAATDMASFGAGAVTESVDADRIAGERLTAASGFLFVQNEWMPTERINLTAGSRLDAHEAYGVRISPKIAAMWRPFDPITLRAGIGGGFKAPTFQQLYLDFTNPSVGYSVFGSTGIAAGIERLATQGSLREVLMPIDGIGELRPEHSLSLYVGGDFDLGEIVHLKGNLYRNNVHDLIDAVPVAMKQNGQNVFTYRNLESVVTQGVDAEVGLRLMDSLTIALGYSYLDAYDVRQLEAVRAGEIGKVGSTGRVRPVQPSEYGGLFNRSRHSACVRLEWASAELGTSATLRGVILGRYGYSDLNVNGVLDDASEYAPGYALWNASISKDITRGILLYASFDNLLDKRDSRLPSLPGRRVNIGLRMSYR